MLHTQVSAKTDFSYIKKAAMPHLAQQVGSEMHIYKMANHEKVDLKQI